MNPAPLARGTKPIPRRSVKRARLDREHRERKRQFLAARPWCELRLNGCTGRATVIDHVLPRSRRPDLIWDETNWAAGCSACNQRKGSRVLA